MTYNAPNTIYYKAAVDFFEAARPIFLQAKKFLKKIGVKNSEDIWANGLKSFLESLKPQDVQKSGQSLERLRRSSRLCKNKPKFATIKNSSVVWAKIKGFPYYPAQIIKLGRLGASNSKAIPKEILRNAKSKKENFCLVKFFDADGAYALVGKNTIKPLGEDFDTDFSKIVQKKGVVVKSTKQDLFRAFQEARNWSMARR